MITNTIYQSPLDEEELFQKITYTDRKFQCVSSLSSLVAKSSFVLTQPWAGNTSCSSGVCCWEMHMDSNLWSNSHLNLFVTCAFMCLVNCGVSLCSNCEMSSSSSWVTKDGMRTWSNVLSDTHTKTNSIHMTRVLFSANNNGLDVILILAHKTSLWALLH